ncbi:MAG TPA: phosphatase PAP2 family protein [Nocardioides sp.]|nr:phosphatase PAP2 family protein [Nocardioides sp.]
MLTELQATQATTAPSARRELAILAALYVGYSAARTLASNHLKPALTRAADIAHAERLLHIPGEVGLNRLATMHEWVGVASSFWYATAHYLVTLVVLLWLFTRRHDVYVPARRALVVASLAALSLYLLLPTAPPRMLPGFTDVLALHSDVGWWGGDASAPKGLGSMTNELAAFPSMHAGWALWVALALWAASTSWVVRGLGVAHALITALVVIATANHWTVDVVVGQLLVLAVWFGFAGRVSPDGRRPSRVPAPSTPER